MVSTSIADVECKHALSKHWADRPFATIVAKHLNQEFMCMKRDAHMEADAWSKVAIDDTQKPQTQPQAKSGPLVVQCKPVHKRRQSALMLFRKDWVKGQQKLLGTAGKVNPATKDSWNEVKAAWQSLDNASRAYYQQLSERSGEELEIKRAQAAAAASLASQPSPESAGGLALALRADRPAEPCMNPWLLDASALEAQTDLEALEDAHQDAMQVKLQEQTEPQGHVLGDDNDDTPISEEMLDSNWRQNLSRGITWADMLAQFDQDAQRFVQPPPGFSFPRQVQYHGWCGSFCRIHHDNQLATFFSNLMQSLQMVVASHGAVGVAAQTSILLQFRVESSIGSKDIFAWLVAPSASSGPHPASQVFVLCDQLQCRCCHEADGGSPYLFHLGLQTTSQQESSHSFASTLFEVGPLHHMVGDELCEHILYSCDGVDVYPEAVSIVELCFQDLSLKSVGVVGPLDGTFAIEVSAQGCFQDGAEERDEAEEDDANANPPADDLLSLVCEEPVRKRKPRKNKAAVGIGGATSTDLRKHLVEEAQNRTAIAEDDLLKALSEDQRQLVKAVGGSSYFD